jgi:GntR family transcriptional regulator, transcriptional repressor for pyruvate dehydrogenase complex
MISLSALETRKKARSLSTALMDTLAGQIRAGVLNPGEKLPTEATMMGQHGVSRTVVREAISKLQSAGLVTTKHGIGTFVADTGAPVRFELEAKSIPTVLDVLAMLEFRISLESEAAALAAARRTEEQLQALRRALDDFQNAQTDGGSGAETDFQFHLRIAEASGNRYFPEVFAHFGMSSIPRTRVTLFKSADDQAAFMMLLIREHEQIYGAILCGDPKLAAKFMRIHLSNSRDRFRKAQERALRTAD